ncbi:hypothetical protein HK104_005881 [Borealophlyctis nickersoniae]|nr:hypothetical protein HK104_005881 [Borealophlyctis nickersoniae]
MNLAAAIDLEHGVGDHTVDPPSPVNPSNGVPGGPTGPNPHSAPPPGRLPAMDRFVRVCKACLSENLSPDKTKTICNNDGCAIQGQLQPRTFRLKCKFCGTMCHNSPRGDLYYRNHLAKEHPELGYERAVEQPRKRKLSPDAASGADAAKARAFMTDGMDLHRPESVDRMNLKIANRKIDILEARLAAKERMEMDTKKWHAETLEDMRQQQLNAEIRHQQESEELRRQMQAEQRRLHEMMEELRRQHQRALERQGQEIEALRRDKELIERQLEAELERSEAFDERLTMLGGTPTHEGIQE